MKFLKIAFLLVLLPLVMAASAHKFYVSITTIEYAPQEQTLQIITKIFLDDIEDALEARHTKKFYFNSAKETEAGSKLLEEYVFQKIKISVNGKPAAFNYIGKRYDIDVVELFIEVPNVTKLNSIEVENNVLLEMFPEQRNIIHVKKNETRRSLILENQNPKGLLKFDN